MDGDDLALWLAIAALVGLGVRTAQAQPRSARAWTSVAVAAAALAGARIASPRAATVMALALLAQLSLAAVLLRLAQGALRAGRTARARAFAAPLRWSPMPGHRVVGRMLAATADSADGRIVDARARLEAIAAGGSPFAVQARVIALGLAQRWAEIAGMPDASPRGAHLRALGEVGDLHALLTAYEADVAAGRFAGADDVALTTLVVVALCGRVEATVALLATLPLLGAAQRAFWLATARGAAGDSAGAERDLAAAVAAQPQLADAVAWRRAWLEGRPTPDAAAADLVARRGLALARLRAASAPRAPLVTLAACATWIGVHAARLALGTPLSAGALDSARFVPREWWRLLSSSVLHAGWLHLGMNTLAMLVFGPQVERRIGRARLVALLAIGAVGSGATVVCAHRFGWLPRQVLVGASGAVMAVLGALIALALAAGRAGDAAARARLPTMLAMILLEVLFDHLHARVSGAAHLGGLVVGVLFGLAVAPAQAGPRADSDGSARR